MERELAALRLEVENLKRRVPARIGTNTAPETVQEVVRQASHGLTVGTCIAHNGTAWAGSSTATHIVSDVISANVFVAVSHGRITGLSGLTAGAVYGSTSLGVLTSVNVLLTLDPHTILTADSATSGIVNAGLLSTRVSYGLDYYIPSGSPTTFTAYPATSVASSDATSAVEGLVLPIGGVSVVVRQGSWTLTADSGLAAGTYYLSATTPGAITATPPSIPNRIVPIATFGAWNASTQSVRVYGGIDRIPEPLVTLSSLGGVPTSRAISAGTGLSGGGDLSADRTLALANTAVSAGSYGSGAAIPVLTIDAQGRITAASTSAVTPPSGSVGLTVNSADTTDAAALTLSGSFYAQTWTMYEKRPRFNAKWIAGTELNTTAPTTKYQILKYDNISGKAYWIDWAGVTPRTGDIVYVDTAEASGYALGYAGKARSVLGRSAATDGAPAPIDATSDNFVLGRRSGVLTFAKVERAELADGTACTVIGRSANSTGAVADISGAANQVLVCNDTPALAFSRTITLGDTSNAGSITIGNATSATAIVLSPSLVNAAGKVMSVREIDVCDGGTAKKMLILASAPY